LAIVLLRCHQHCQPGDNSAPDFTSCAFRGRYDLFAFVVAAFTSFVGLNVWMVTKSAFILLKSLFIFMLVFGCLGTAAAFFVWWSEGDLDSVTMIVGLRQILFVLLWWPYFSASKRVKATFGANL